MTNAVPQRPVSDSFRRYLKNRLTEDRPVLEKILDDAAYLVEHRSFATAGKRFGELRIRLERHMAVEREVLFPLLGTATPESSDIGKVKSEHAVIRTWMEKTGSAISGWDAGGFKRAQHHLAAALKAYTADEDKLLESSSESCGCSEQDLILKMARL